MAKRKEGTSPSLLLVHLGDSNPNRVSSLHGKSARGDGSPLSRLSEADETAPQARHGEAAFVFLTRLTFGKGLGGGAAPPPINLSEADETAP